MSNESPKPLLPVNTGQKPIPQQAPNCLKCAYFKVTWDALFPRACEIFGFKTSTLPSHEVFRATGSNCPTFRLKEGLK